MKDKNRLINLGILLLSACVLIGFVFADGPDRLWKAVSGVNPALLAGGVACMVAYWGLESLSLHAAARRLYPAQRISDSVAVSMIGQLFNCITPFASGGQPVQAYHMMARGMPLGLASSALLCKFVVYQTVLSLYSLVTLVFRFRFFSRSVSGFGLLVLLGFVVNAGVVALLIGVCCFPRPTRRAADAVLRLCHKIRLVKDLEKARASLTCELEGFYQSFALLKRSPGLLLWLSLLAAAQLTAFFAAPYFVCLALGARNAQAFTVIAAGAFVLMISSFVPLPGGSGGAEGGFYLFFHMFFEGPSLLALAVLLWRVITFYLPILVGSCFQAAARGRRGYEAR